MTIILKKYWPLAGIGLLLVIVGFYLVQAQKGIEENQLLAELASKEGVTLKNIHYTQKDPGKGLRWVLDASKANLSKDKRLLHFSRFRLKLESDKGPGLQLEGKNGEYDKSTGEMTFSGDLRGRTDNGYTIATNSAVYSQKQGNLKTDDQVEISGPFFSVKGEGLFLNIEKEILIIRSKATTLIDSKQLIL